MAQAAAPARRHGSVEYENPILSRLDPVMEHTDLSMRPVLRKKASTGARSAKTSMSKQSMVSVSERFKETTEQNMKRELSIGDATASRLRTLPAAQKKILGMKEAPLHEGSSVPGLVRIPPLSIKPDHMYGITLIAHPSMTPSLLQFADEYSDVLSRFKLSVQAELEEDFLEILGEHYEFGAMIDFGALGGDQQVSTQIVVQAVGCIIYFGDPVNMTPYHSDTEALERLINVTNIIYASNPTTAVALMEVLGEGVRGKPELMPSMFTKLESPAVEEYAKQQKAIVEQMKARAGGGGPAGSSTKDLQGFDAGKMKASAESRVAHHMKNAVRAVQLMERVNFHLHTSGDATVSLLGAEKPATPEKRNGPPSSAQMEIDAKDMRCLALISHNHMKPAMQDFVVQNKEVLRKFRLTGTNSTMTMLRSVLGEDANFGPGCASGPLGGDAQVGAQLCLSDIGGVIFFTDPLSAHPHMADVLALVRLVNVKNVLHATNTATATALIQLLGKALHGYPELIPSFFKDLASPAIGAGHENEDEKEFNRLENDRMSDGGPQRPVLEQEKLPSIAELRTSRRSEAATPGSAKALLSANALGIAKTLDSTPPPTPPPATLPPTVDDSTTKALLIGAAVVVGTTMMMTVGGLTIVGVMLLRSKK